MTAEPSIDHDTQHAAVIVVIPFYQRERGILNRALRSVEAQDCTLPKRVYVVDDGSPAPVADELKDLDPAYRTPITVLTQANCGPGGARNLALDRVPSGTRYVAFLDSDDEWSPQHLSNAVEALRAGCDVYFANLTQLDQRVGAFERAGRMDIASHPSIAGRGDLHRYSGDMIAQIITGNVIGTSTVVYEWMRHSEVRFRTEFRNAGEDYLFWLELAARGAQFGFSDRIAASYGRGVNVYAGSGWGTDAHLLRLINELRYRKVARSDFARSPDIRTFIRGKEQELRLEILRDIAHRARIGRSPPVAWLLELFRTDPLFPLFALSAMARTFAQRMRGS